MIVGHAWDAVRVPDELGIRALHRLKDGSGAVIGDAIGRCLYWLIPPGTADGWQLPGIQVLNAGPPGVLRFVEVPPAGMVCGPGPHWVVPYQTDAYLTSAEQLHEALRADADELAPAEPAPGGAR
ncbi:hypothetical protein ACZ90_12700 [Streptomyces albus subsp. albus]|nr:hypothetical protein ACZ90_12700 [Streptomyces albus subsp. albus]